MKVIITNLEVREISLLLKKLKGNQRAHDLAQTLLTQCKEQRNTEDYQEAAHAASNEGNIEVDDNATVSHGDSDGAYVNAWLWIPKACMLEARRARLARQRQEKAEAGK